MQRFLHSFQPIPLKILLLIISAYILYFITIPPMSIHDEPAHIQIVVSIAKGGYAKIWTPGEYGKDLMMVDRIDHTLNYVDYPDIRPNYSGLSTLKELPSDYDMTDVYSHEAFGSLLYYVVGAGFYFLSKLTPYLIWQFYILRLTSALFYIATVFIAWHILLHFFKNKNTATAFLLFFSLNPLVLKMAIGVNPDIGLTFFSLLFLLVLLKTNMKALKNKHVFKLSALSALTTLTKISGVFTNWGFSLWLLYTNKFRIKTFRILVVFQIVFFAIITPWFLFIFQRYQTFFPEPFSRSCDLVADSSVLHKLFLTVFEFRHTLMHYSGFMGQAWPHPFNFFFVSYVIGFTVLCLLGVSIAWRKKEQKYKLLIFYTLPVFLFLGLISLIHRFDLMNCDIQGRYMLPVFFVLSFFVGLAVIRLCKKEERAALILKAFAIFHYLFILFTVLLLRYYV